MASKNDIKSTSGEIAKSMKHEYAKRTDDAQDAVSDFRNEVRDAAENLREEYDRRVDQVHEQLDQSIDGSRKTVQGHPLIAVGVALTIGIIAGLFIRRQSKA
jgi:ElaB/YqjD/DUF883 family membrane-anchored ribosome-binding protein